MEKKTIVARAEVLEGKEKEFIAKAEKLIEATRAEEGNISYTLYQCPSSTKNTRIKERWLFTLHQSILKHSAKR